jgi:hypothetical protein
MNIGVRQEVEAPSERQREAIRKHNNQPNEMLFFERREVN